MKSKRVTLLDVAKHAGVSRATASLIVRGSPKVNDKTRDKVLDSIRELGYVYDRVAANMRSHTSSTVGLIITDIANPYYAELLTGVHNTLAEYDFIEFLGTTYDSDKNLELLVSKMMEHRVGGIILCPVSKTSDQTIKRLKGLDIPIVLAVRELDEVNTDYVGIDYIEGTKMAVSHLLNKGHKRIAYLGGTEESSAFKERKSGYLKALTEAGLDESDALIIESPISREGGRQALAELMTYREFPTACICWNDMVAHGVMEEAKKEGLVIGEDLSIAGFDNIQESSMYNPPLTTVASFPGEIGKQAASLLYQRMTQPNKNSQRIILKPELVIRAST